MIIQRYNVLGGLDGLADTLLATRVPPLGVEGSLFGGLSLVVLDCSSVLPVYVTHK